MKKIILTTILVFITFFIGISDISAQTDNTQLTEIIKEGAFLVDVRTPEEFSEGSAEGAVNIPLDEVENQLSKFKGKKHIVVFCRSGNRSGKAKNILEENGFENVTNGGPWQNVDEIVKHCQSECKKK